MEKLSKVNTNEWVAYLDDEDVKWLHERKSSGGEKVGAVTGKLVEDTDKPWRAILLEEATRITTSDRDKQYGNPEDNFQNIAMIWNAYWNAKHGLRQGSHFNSADVAQLMILMKAARLATNPSHWDSLVDQAGYAACGGDIAKQNERT